MKNLKWDGSLREGLHCLISQAPLSVMDNIPFSQYILMLLGDTGKGYNPSLLPPEAINEAFPKHHKQRKMPGAQPKPMPFGHLPEGEGKFKRPVWQRVHSHILKDYKYRQMLLEDA